MNIQEFKNSKIYIQLDLKKELDSETLHELYELARMRVGDDFETSIDNWKEFISNNLMNIFPDVVEEAIDSINININ